jgi:single-strand DNA-binding protein
MNKIILIGRLTKDVEIKTTQTGKKVASFSLAIDDGKSPEGQKQTIFINCTAWERKAEILESYTSKGSQLSIIGKLQTRSYEKDGVKKYVTDVLVSELELLGSRKESQSQNQPLPEVDEIDLAEIETLMPF